MNLVIIQRRYNDGDTPSQAILGWVKTEYGESDIDRFWKNWQEEVPEPN
jgi:ABC-type thiamine transport system substrate-binding protein